MCRNLKTAAGSGIVRKLGASAGLLALVVALSLTATAVTLALFSAASASEADSFAAGAVTLVNSAITTCPVSGLLPGASPQTCTFTATYSGSASAYLAADVLIETQAGSGGSKLYDPSDSANDLAITITSSSPSVTYTAPTSPTTCPGSAPGGSTCYELDNELVATTAFSSAAVTFSVAAAVPATSTTGYQGGAAQIILTTHAVQSGGGNALSCTTTPAAGSPCAASGSFNWS
jgi:hypothetical protein